MSNTEIVSIPFKYDDLETETRIVVQQRASEIRALMRQTAQGAIDVGEKLADVRDRLGPGKFTSWCETEFKWSRSAAYRFMRVFEQFGRSNLAQADIAPSALYLLADPSTPDGIRDAVIGRAQTGVPITHKEVKQLVDAAKRTPPPTPEPVASDLATVLNELRRLKLEGRSPVHRQVLERQCVQRGLAPLIFLKAVTQLVRDQQVTQDGLLYELVRPPEPAEAPDDAAASQAQEPSTTPIDLAALIAHYTERIPAALANGPLTYYDLRVALGCEPPSDPNEVKAVTRACETLVLTGKIGRDNDLNYILKGEVPASSQSLYTLILDYQPRILELLQARPRKYIELRDALGIEQNEPMKLDAMGRALDTLLGSQLIQKCQGLFVMPGCDLDALFDRPAPDAPTAPNLPTNEPVAAEAEQAPELPASAFVEAPAVAEDELHPAFNPDAIKLLGLADDRARRYSLDVARHLVAADLWNGTDELRFDAYSLHWKLLGPFPTKPADLKPGEHYVIIFPDERIASAIQDALVGRILSHSELWDAVNERLHYPVNAAQFASTEDALRKAGTIRMAGSRFKLGDDAAAPTPELVPDVAPPPQMAAAANRPAQHSDDHNADLDDAIKAEIGFASAVNAAHCAIAALLNIRGIAALWALPEDRSKALYAQLGSLLRRLNETPLDLYLATQMGRLDYMQEKHQPYPETRTTLEVDPKTRLHRALSEIQCVRSGDAAWDALTPPARRDLLREIAQAESHLAQIKTRVRPLQVAGGS